MAVAIVQRFAMLSRRSKIHLETSQRIVLNLSILRGKTLVGQALFVHKRFFSDTSSLLKNKLGENGIVAGENVSRLQIKKKSRNRILINNKILKSNVSSVIGKLLLNIAIKINN